MDIDIKDSVVRLYVRRFVIPRALIFDKPGFVDFKISGKTSVQLRQVLLPESFFIKFEEKIVKKFGDKGKKALYSIGKKFGYSFAINGRFENINDHPGESVKDWVVVASKFVEGTYASNISQKIDVPEKTVDYELKNFVVCRKLGYDYFLATGGAAGLLAWILQDKSIEGVMHDEKTVGNDFFCTVTCAPVSKLKQKFKEEVYSETDLEGLENDKMSYLTFNKEVDIQYKKSLATFLNSKTFSYSDGIIMYKEKERFFLMEVSGMYLFELGINNQEMKNLMFETAFDVGFEMFHEFTKENTIGAIEILCALGWGEILILPANKKIRLLINYFPWTKFYKDINFDIIRGILSGIFSRSYQKKITFGKPKTDILKGQLALVFESEEQI